MQKRSKIFDWLRLGGALAVLIGHSFVLLGRPAPFGIDWHVYGVLLFFLVSGYLIAGSWRADPRFLRFAEKRARRIMPGLVAVVLLTALLLGPLLTTSPDYWPGALRYIWRNVLLLPLHALPGVFEGNPQPAVNGSLWTLPVEVFCYVLTPLLVFAGRWACLAAAAALLAFPLTGEIAGFGLSGASSVIPWFLIGAALKLFDVPAPDLRVPALPADLSYGLYLTAFPAQQTLIALQPGVAPGTLALATLAVCAPLAWLSWTFVERPLIRGATKIE